MANNTYTKNYLDGTALTESQLDAALTTVSPDITQMAQATTGSTSGQVLTSAGSNVQPSFQTLPDPKGPYTLRNYGLSAAISSGALRISLKTAAGLDPASSSAVSIQFSGSGTTSVTPSNIDIVAARGITINATAFLRDTAFSLSNPVYVYTYKSGSTGYLAVSSSGNIDEGKAVTTVAMSSGATKFGTLYATAALSVIPKLLGHVQSANTGTAWTTPTATRIQPGQYQTPIESPTTNGLTVSSTIFVNTMTSLSISTSGRPLMVSLVPADGSTDSYIEWAQTVASAGGVDADVSWRLTRDGSPIGTFRARNFISLASATAVSGIQTLRLPPGIVFTIDNTASAGVHTFNFQQKSNVASSRLRAVNCKLIVVEL